MHWQGELMATPLIRDVIWRMQNLFVHPHGNSPLAKNNLLVKLTNLNVCFFACWFLQDLPVLERIEIELALMEVPPKLLSGNWSHCLCSAAWPERCEQRVCLLSWSCSPLCAQLENAWTFSRKFRKCWVLTIIIIQILPGNRLQFFLRLLLFYFIKDLSFLIKPVVSLFYESVQSSFLLHVCVCFSDMGQASFVTKIAGM